MRRKPYVPTIGTVSRGTLLDVDLIDAFLWELCRVAPRGYGKLKAEAGKYNSETDHYGDEGSELVNELQDALSENAPPFLYFGNTEGDGSDFGWWPEMESIEELPTYEDTGHAARARFVGEFKTVSDHGNVEIYVRFANGRIKSIMGIV